MAQGHEKIRQHLETMPDQPGVYRMLNIQGTVIYVGKAKNLRKRLTAYTRLHGHVKRIQRMISQTAQVEITTTSTEAEALLLESNLIKRLQPHYNILLRDDKSFPYILLRTNHPWPQIRKHRGPRNQPGDYYGPFAAINAVNETLATIERAFLIRSCSDTVFANRTRPCLLYQIKRCCAPCVGRISAADYSRLVTETCAFLEGRDHKVLDSLTQRMQEASTRQEYERAVIYRDRIRALRRLQVRQEANNPVMGDGDVIGLYQEKGHSCVQIFFYRAGRNYGNRAYFPRHEGTATAEAVLSAFIGQFYAARPAPKTLILSHKVKEAPLISEALTTRSGHRVQIVIPQRGGKKEAAQNAVDNAREALIRKLSDNQAGTRLLEQVAARFGLESPPQRIEVYDNSHIQGRHALGAMVVAGPEGFERTAYRKFNARDSLHKPGDDHALLREVLTRRFRRLLREDQESGEAIWPDLLLIDGGSGQLSTAQATLADLGLEKIPVIAIAKGPQRRAGKERFYRPGSPPLTLDARDPVLHYTQRLRDEVHRFAITGHRNRRAGAIRRSLLEDIPGVGPGRKRSLILHLGSAQKISQTPIAELKKIPGINDTLARIIYDHFHETDPPTDDSPQPNKPEAGKKQSPK